MLNLNRLRASTQIACSLHRQVPCIGRFLHHLHQTLLKSDNRVSFHKDTSTAFFSTTSTMATEKHTMAKRLEGTDKNIWVEFVNLVSQYKPLNLGQGFPDFFPPQYIRDALTTAVASDNFLMNQYTRSFGHPRLVNALGKLFSPILGHEIKPMEDIVITTGAYGALFYTVQGLLNPGDEAIIIEPYFDCYEPMVKVAGGIPVFIPLRPPKSGKATSSGDFTLDPDELASKFTEKTKLFFLNNPNNPLGKVYTREELEMIGELCKKHGVIIVSDEVYEWMVFDKNKHIKTASLPDLWDHTITIGSAGKTFSVTGWKIGWALGPAHLIRCLQTVHQNCSYTCPTPIQEALAVGFELEMSRLDSPECYFRQLSQELEIKRDRMAEMVRKVGMVPIVPEGAYFLTANYESLGFEMDPNDTETKDYQFNKWMMKEKGISAIPPSAFYSQPHKTMAQNIIRLCFIKDDSTLDEAEKVFTKWKNSS